MIKLTSKQEQYERVMFKWGENLVLSVKLRLWVLFGVYSLGVQYIGHEWNVLATVVFLAVWWLWIERPEGDMIRKALHLTHPPKEEKKKENVTT